MKTTLKTLALVLTLSLFSSTAINAGTRHPENIKDRIQKEISYPTNAKSEKIEGVVLVSFVINDGQVEIETANASNEILKEYVVSKLKSLVFRGEQEQKYNMKFEFKLL